MPCLLSSFLPLDRHDEMMIESHTIRITDYLLGTRVPYVLQRLHDPGGSYGLATDLKKARLWLPYTCNGF